MSEKAPKTESPSLESLVSDFEGIIKEAARITEEPVAPGDEDSAIFRLGKFKMDFLQPLIGKVHFETGDNSLEDYGTSESVLDDEANNKLMGAINGIQHRVQELEAQKRSKAA